MSHVLPSPTRSLAIPLATLVLGAGAGIGATAILNEDDIVFRSSPAAAVVEPRATPAPVPERVAPAPTKSSVSASKSPAPVPERVGPQPQTSSLSGTSTPPVPERVSGARIR